jgi:hypothetical protein
MLTSSKERIELVVDERTVTFPGHDMDDSCRRLSGRRSLNGTGHAAVDRKVLVPKSAHRRLANLAPSGTIPSSRNHQNAIASLLARARMPTFPDRVPRSGGATEHRSATARSEALEPRGDKLGRDAVGLSSPSPAQVALDNSESHFFSTHRR